MGRRRYCLRQITIYIPAHELPYIKEDKAAPLKKVLENFVLRKMRLITFSEKRQKLIVESWRIGHTQLNRRGSKASNSTRALEITFWKLPFWIASEEGKIN